MVGKFSIRIVPNQTPDAIEALVRAHVDKAFAQLGSPNRCELAVDKALF